MTHDHHDPLEYIEGKLRLVWYVIVNTWGAWSCFFIGLAFKYAGDVLFSSALLLVSAVWLLNGGGGSRFIFWGNGASWWRTHRFLLPLHHATSEGEIAGIGLGLIMVAVWPGAMEGFHMPWSAFFTILGIMSAANLAAGNFAGILSVIEQRLGKFAMLVIGSLLASLIGEPAAAILKTEYLKNRYKQEDKGMVAALLATSIGFGGGILYHAAPPILIIWPLLQSSFGWSVLDLLLYVGAPVVLSVVVVALILTRYISSVEHYKGTCRSDYVAAIGLVLLVVLHMVVPQSRLLWLLDGFIAVMNVLVTTAIYDEARHHREREAHIGRDSDRAEADHQLAMLREEQFSKTWQPVLLACLLVSLDLIGHHGEPFIHMLGELLPNHWPTVYFAIATFFLSAVTSHFADNALASRVYIAIPIAMIASIGLQDATVVAVAVVLGALFGGFLTVPANLPNFTIARSFNVMPKEWPGTAWKLYPIGVIPVCWIVFLSHMGW